MPQSKRGIMIFKILFSFFALYQVFAMVVMPNLGSYLGRSVQGFIAPYSSAMGLNANWNFFSPNPAHTMYIHYTIHYTRTADQLEDELKEAPAEAQAISDVPAKAPVEGYFPPEKNRGIESFNRQRELYVMRFMIIYPKRLQYLMGPWLCRQYPGAQSVDLEHVIETVPSLDESVTFKDENVRDLSRELQVVKAEYSCSGEALDEVEFL